MDDEDDFGNVKPEVISGKPAKVPRNSGMFSASGNPGGKLKSVKAMIERYGEEIVAEMIDMARGAATETRYTKDGDPYEASIRIADRLKAMEMSMAYWLGKPKDDVDTDKIEGEQQQAIDLSKLSPDEQRTMFELVKKARG